MSKPSDYTLDPVTVTGVSTANKSAPGTQQFGRKFSFVVGTSSGQGVEVGAFRCVFHIQRGDYQNPNSADIRVYNLSKADANGLSQKEFTQIAVQAGYPGNYGLIFRGTLAQARIGRESGTDTFVDFTAGDGDEAYHFATIVGSQAAGPNSATNALNSYLKAMERFAVVPGDMPELPSDDFPRGRVFFGAVRDEIREFAASHDLLWSIQDGKLTLIPQTSYIAGDIPIISPSTGLIGTPEQTQNGLQMRVLLNPSIKIGQAIRLQDANGVAAGALGSQLAVNQYRYDLGINSVPNNFNARLTNKLNGQGLYYVMSANHTGDTRGNEWYTDLICLAIDATLPAGGNATLEAFQASRGPIFRY